MTPKEKAKELFDKFMKPVDGLHKYPMCFDTAKQCALIAVEFSKEFITGDLSEAFDKFLYIQEIKQEIEKL
jgi:hypothetical protein